jgi:hypothetical protein
LAAESKAPRATPRCAWRSNLFPRRIWTRPALRRQQNSREAEWAVDPESRHEARRRYNGFDALKIDYTGTDQNGETDITMILIALPEKSGFVAICTWGDDEAQTAVSSDLLAIADSVRVAR